MAFCTICGAQLEPNAKFCVICGAKAVEIPTQPSQPTQPAQPAQPTDPVQPAPAVTGFYNAQPDPTQPPAPDAEQTPPDAQQTPPPPPQPSYQPVTQQQPFNTQQQQTVPPAANGFDPQDIQSNKIMAALAYVGWLILIPLFARRESPFTRFHCNQGLILAFAWLAIVVLRSVSASLHLPLDFIFSLLSVAVVVFSVIGIINVVQGEAKELPLIGKLRILK